MQIRTDQTELSRQQAMEAFRNFGIGHLCYIKKVATRRGASRPLAGHAQAAQYVIHAADGTYLWRYRDRALADAALRQHDMEPLSVH